jgi:acyl-coenzyme A thioesterase PaaI-like protein
VPGHDRKGHMDSAEPTPGGKPAHEPDVSVADVSEPDVSVADVSVADVRTVAVRAVARTRALGMHYYGHILGITTSAAADGSPRPHLSPDPSVTPGDVPPVSLATVADLAMGSAVRAALSPGRRLGTVSMTLHHTCSAVPAPVATDASVVWMAPDESQGVTRCDLTDAAGRLVGVAQGWFMALPVPDGVRLPLLPWERVQPPQIEPLAYGDLDPLERAAVGSTVEAARRSRERGTSVSEELTAPAWSEAPAEGTAHGTVTIGPALGNRVGHVQGGALYGIALAAAARAAGPGLEVAEGHVQFLRPAAGEVLTAEGTVIRRGRGAAFAEASLTVDGRPVVTGLFAFRPAGPAGSGGPSTSGGRGIRTHEEL